MCLAIPAKVVAADKTEGPDRGGTIEFGNVRKDVSLAFVPEAKVDDYVLVHTGFAIQVVDEEEAERILGYLREMEEVLEEELGGPSA